MKDFKDARAVGHKKWTRGLVSIVIVNFNGGPFIGKCLNSVLASDYKNFEVIIVDNGSSDGSIEFIERVFGSDPRIKIIQNKKNLGPAVGRNMGADFARGEFICFLDNDTEVNPQWLTGLINVLRSKQTIGSVQPKLMLNNSAVDGLGDFVDILGDAFSFGNRERDLELIKPSEIFSSKGAAIAVRHKVFDEVDGFDERIFHYFDDVDFGWRIRLSGYTNVLVPTSVVYHAGGRGRKRDVSYCIYNNEKNRTMMLIKNHTLHLMILSLPLAIVSAFVKSLFTSFTNKNSKALTSCFKAVFQSLFNKQTWYERRKVQTMANKISHAQIKNYMLSPPLIIVKIIWRLFYRNIDLSIFLNNIYKNRINLAEQTSTMMLDHIKHA